MKYSGYWLSIVGMNLDNHVLHTFLSCNLSFPSLSPVTSLITPRNDGPVLTNFTLAGRNNFKTTSDVGCSKIITPTVNIIVYDSMLQRCDRHRQLPGYLSFNSLTLEPSCRHCQIQHTIDRHDKLG